MKKQDYLNAELSTPIRVKDLMSRMSLEEKVRQLGCTMAVGPADASQLDIEGGIGEVACMAGAETPKATAEWVRDTQEKIIESSPNGIPAIFHCEALTGPAMPESVLYPTSISLGATFNPEAVKDMADRTRQQMMGLGIRQALSPVLDVTKDFRWGRASETYGGDPTLVSSMSCAFVDGLQGKDGKEGVAATAKHFLGYAQTEGGLNMARTLSDEREVREIFAKPFEAAINRSNVRSVMNTYGEINGEPACSSKKIMTDLLRDDLNFNGVVVSDYMSIPRLVTAFRTAEDVTDASIQCLNAGLDVECPIRQGYNEDFVKAAEEGRIDESVIDLSVERILSLKFDLGLFENPYPQESFYAKGYVEDDHEAGSLEASRQAMTLTKNNGILPLNTDETKSVAVIGPAGNNLRMHYAVFTYPPMLEMISDTSQMAGLTEDNKGDGEDGEPINMLQQKEGNMEVVNEYVKNTRPGVKTVYEALGDYFDDVSFTAGSVYNTKEDADIEDAVKAAKEADVAILCLGGKNGWGLHCTTGEGIDTTDLDLPGAQEELMRQVFNANENTVLVHTDGRPLVSQWAYDNLPAIIEAWLPGTWGGVAIAETLVGKNNPGGAMPVDVPRSVGQMPVFHYQQNGTNEPTFTAASVNTEGYINEPMTPLVPFGFGLSYTDFEYSHFKLSVDKFNHATASVKVTNTGDAAGSHVVQLYGQDAVASMVRPGQELVGFYRVELSPGESKTITFNFDMSFFAFRDSDKNWILEKGDYHFWAGSDSTNYTRLEENNHFASHRLETTATINPNKRCFFAEVTIDA